MWISWISSILLLVWAAVRVSGVSGFRRGVLPVLALPRRDAVGEYSDSRPASAGPPHFSSENLRDFPADVGAPPPGAGAAERGSQRHRCPDRPQNGPPWWARAWAQRSGTPMVGTGPGTTAQDSIPGARTVPHHRGGTNRANQPRKPTVRAPSVTQRNETHSVTDVMIDHRTRLPGGRGRGRNDSPGVGGDHSHACQDYLSLVFAGF